MKAKVAKVLKTVGEVRDALCMFPSDIPIMGTWEGVTRFLRVYNSADGVVLIDADGGYYQESFETGKKTPYIPEEDDE